MRQRQSSVTTDTQLPVRSIGAPRAVSAADRGAGRWRLLRRNARSAASDSDAEHHRHVSARCHCRVLAGCKVRDTAASTNISVVHAAVVDARDP